MWNRVTHQKLQRKSIQKAWVKANKVPIKYPDLCVLFILNLVTFDTKKENSNFKSIYKANVLRYNTKMKHFQ